MRQKNRKAINLALGKITRGDTYEELEAEFKELAKVSPSILGGFADPGQSHFEALFLMHIPENEVGSPFYFGQPIKDERGFRVAVCFGDERDALDYSQYIGDSFVWMLRRYPSDEMIIGCKRPQGHLDAIIHYYGRGLYSKSVSELRYVLGFRETINPFVLKPVNTDFLSRDLKATLLQRGENQYPWMNYQIKQLTQSKLCEFLVHELKANRVHQFVQRHSEANAVEEFPKLFHELAGTVIGPLLCGGVPYSDLPSEKAILVFRMQSVHTCFLSSDENAELLSGWLATQGCPYILQKLGGGLFQSSESHRFDADLAQVALGIMNCRNAEELQSFLSGRSSNTSGEWDKLDNDHSESGWNSV